MILRDPIVIPIDKIKNYLLVWKPLNDKSRFLATAGYFSANWERLMIDLQEQVLPLDAKIESESEYGTFYQIEAPLTGPNGKTISVKTVWLKDYRKNEIRFITLIPRK